MHQRAHSNGSSEGSNDRRIANAVALFNLAARSQIGMFEQAKRNLTCCGCTVVWSRIKTQVNLFSTSAEYWFLAALHDIHDGVNFSKGLGLTSDWGRTDSEAKALNQSHRNNLPKKIFDLRLMRANQVQAMDGYLKPLNELADEIAGRLLIDKDAAIPRMAAVKPVVLSVAASVVSGDSKAFDAKALDGGADLGEPGEPGASEPLNVGSAGFSIVNYGAAVRKKLRWIRDKLDRISDKANSLATYNDWLQRYETLENNIQASIDEYNKAHTAQEEYYDRLLLALDENKAETDKLITAAGLAPQIEGEQAQPVNIGPRGLNSKIPGILLGTGLTSLITFFPAKMIALHASATAAKIALGVLSAPVAPFIVAAGIIASVCGTKNIGQAFWYGSIGNRFRADGEENTPEVSKKGLAGNIGIAACIGGAVGTLIFPGIGTAIGLAIGAVAGLILGGIGIRNLGLAFRDFFYGFGSGFMGGILAGFAPIANYSEFTNRWDETIKKRKFALPGLIVGGVIFGVFGAIGRIIKDFAVGLWDGLVGGAQFGFSPFGKNGAIVKSIQDHAKDLNIAAFPGMLVSGIVFGFFGALGRVIKDIAVGLWDGLVGGLRLGFSPFGKHKVTQDAAEVEHENHQPLVDSANKHWKERNIFAFPGMLVSGIVFGFFGALGRVIKDFAVGLWDGLVGGAQFGFSPFGKNGAIVKSIQDHAKDLNIAAFPGMLVSGIVFGFFGALGRVIKDFAEGLWDGLVSGLRLGFSPFGKHKVTQAGAEAREEEHENHKPLVDSAAKHWKERNIFAFPGMLVSGIVFGFFGAVGRVIKDFVVGLWDGVVGGLQLGYSPFGKNGAIVKSIKDHAKDLNIAAFPGMLVSGIVFGFFGALGRVIKDFAVGLWDGLVGGAQFGFSPFEKNAAIVKSIKDHAAARNIAAFPGMLVSGVIFGFFGALGRICKDFAYGILGGIFYGARFGFAPKENSKEFTTEVSEQYKQRNIFRLVFGAIPTGLSIVVGLISRAVFDFGFGFIFSAKASLQAGFSYGKDTKEWNQWWGIHRLVENHGALPGLLVSGFVFGLFGALGRSIKDFAVGLWDGLVGGAQFGFSPFGKNGAIVKSIQDHAKAINIFAFPGMLVSGIVFGFFGALGRVIKDLAVGLWDGLVGGAQFGFSPFEKNSAIVKSIQDHAKDLNIAAFPGMLVSGIVFGFFGALGRVIKDFAEGLWDGLVGGAQFGFSPFEKNSALVKSAKDHWKERNIFAFPGMLVSGIVFGFFGALGRVIKDFAVGLWDGLVGGAQFGFSPFEKNAAIVKSIKDHAKDLNIAAFPGMLVSGIVFGFFGALGRICKDLAYGIFGGIFYGARFGFAPKENRKEFTTEVSEQYKQRNIFRLVFGVIPTGLSIIVGLISRAVFDFGFGFIFSAKASLQAGFSYGKDTKEWNQWWGIHRLVENHGALPGLLVSGFVFGLFGALGRSIKDFAVGLWDGLVGGAQFGFSPFGKNGTFVKSAKDHWEKRNIFAFPGMLVSGIVFGFFGALGRVIKDFAVGLWDGLVGGAQFGFSPFEKNGALVKSAKDHWKERNIFAFPGMLVSGIVFGFFGALGRVIKDFAVGLWDGLVGGAQFGFSPFGKNGAIVKSIQDHAKDLNIAAFPGMLVSGIVFGFFGALGRVIKDFAVGLWDGLVGGLRLGFSPFGKHKVTQDAAEVEHENHQPLVDSANKHWKERNIFAFPGMLVSGIVFGFFGVLGRVIKDFAVGLWDGLVGGAQFGFSPFEKNGVLVKSAKDHWKERNIFAFPGILVGGIVFGFFGAVGRVIKDFVVGLWDGVVGGLQLGYSPFGKNGAIVKSIKDHAKDLNIAAFPGMLVSGIVFGFFGALGRVIKDFAVGLWDGLVGGLRLGFSPFGKHKVQQDDALLEAEHENYQPLVDSANKHWKERNIFAFPGMLVSGIVFGFFGALGRVIKDFAVGLWDGLVGGAQFGFSPFEKNGVLVKSAKDHWKERNIFAFPGMLVSGIVFGFFGALGRVIKDFAVGLWDGLVGGAQFGFSPFEKNGVLVKSAKDHWKERNIFAFPGMLVSGIVFGFFGALGRVIKDFAVGLWDGLVGGAQFGFSPFGKNAAIVKSIKDHAAARNIAAFPGMLVSGVILGFFGALGRVIRDFAYGIGSGVIGGFSSGFTSDKEREKNKLPADQAIEGPKPFAEEVKDSPFLARLKWHYKQRNIAALVTTVIFGGISCAIGKLVSFFYGVANGAAKAFEAKRTGTPENHDAYKTAFTDTNIPGKIGMILGGFFGAGVGYLANKAVWEAIGSGLKKVGLLIVGAIAWTAKHILWKSITCIPKLLWSCASAVADAWYGCFSGIKLWRNLVSAVPIISLIAKKTGAMSSNRFAPDALMPLKRRLECDVQPQANVPANEQKDDAKLRHKKAAILHSLNEAVTQLLLNVRSGQKEIEGDNSVVDAANDAYPLMRTLPGLKNNSEKVLKAFHEKLLNGEIEFKDMSAGDGDAKALCAAMNTSLATRDQASFKYRITLFKNCCSREVLQDGFAIELNGYQLAYNVATDKITITLKTNYHAENATRLLDKAPVLVGDAKKGDGGNVFAMPVPSAPALLGRA